MAGVEHLQHLELQRRERRQRAAEPGAEQPAGVREVLAAVLHARDDVAEHERARDVHEQRRPRPLAGIVDERLADEGARDRAGEAAEEDRRQHPAVSARRHGGTVADAPPARRVAHRAGLRSAPVSADVLSPRALNRATLARQLLLERSPMAPLEAVEHLVGMQAQVPHNPYLGLWSRLADFAPEALSALLIDRAVVRIVVMRATIHLVSAADCLTLRPLMQPVLDGELRRHREYAPALVAVDLDAVLAFARRFVDESPRTGGQLRAALAERFPEETPPRWRTRVATCWRSCRSRRAACGGRRCRSRRRPRRRGSAGR